MLDILTLSQLCKKFKTTENRNPKMDLKEMHFYTKFLIESQNHRMLSVGRDLCGSSSPTPLPKQGHLEQADDHTGVLLK